MYYIKIIKFEKNLEDGLIYGGDLYVKIQYNKLITMHALYSSN